jgi:hypothetical protein
MYDRFNPFPLKMTQLISLSMCTGIIPSLSKPKQTPLRSDHPSKPNDAETRPSEQTKCRRYQTIRANQMPPIPDHPSKPNAADTRPSKQTKCRRDHNMQSDGEKQTAAETEPCNQTKRSRDRKPPRPNHAIRHRVAQAVRRLLDPSRKQWEVRSIVKMNSYPVAVHGCVLSETLQYGSPCYLGNSVRGITDNKIPTMRREAVNHIVELNPTALNESGTRGTDRAKKTAAETERCNQTERSRPPPTQNNASRPREAETESR